MAAAVVVLGLLAAGCSGGEPDDSNTLTRKALRDVEEAVWVRAEELAAECMKEQGFEYEPRPNPFPAEPLDNPHESQFAPRLTMEQAKASGFGILDGMLHDSATTDDVGAADPNQEIRESLDGQAQQAWDSALLGVGASDGPGCREEAKAQAREDLAEKVQAVEGRMVDIGQRIEADPRHQQLQDQWSRCMAEEGIEAASMEELGRRLAREARELFLPPRPSLPQAPGESAAESTAPPAPSAATHDPEVVEEFRAREIAAAVASVACFEEQRSLFDEIVADAAEAVDEGSG